MIVPEISGPAKKRPTVLVIDDEAGPRDALKVILRPYYNIQAAESASAAIDVLNSQPIDLITLDQRLPDRRGLDLLQEIKHHYADVEIIVITGYGSVQLAMEGIRHGAVGYLLKPFNVTELLCLVNQTLEKKQRLDFLRHFTRTSISLWGSGIASAQAWKELFTGYQAIGTPTAGHAARSESMPKLLLPLLSDLLEATDRQLLNHCSRVSFYATLLGNRIHLTLAEQKSLVLGAFLHDIGTIGPEPYQFAEDDLAMTGASVGNRQHPEQGATLVVSLGLPAEVEQIIAYHHERWDGSGYPYGLQGKGIPQLARIVCLAQSFDHLTAERSGRSALSIDNASHYLLLHAGTHFDPQLTELFVRVIQECKGSIPALGVATVSTGRSDS